MVDSTLLQSRNNLNPLATNPVKQNIIRPAVTLLLDTCISTFAW